MKKNNLWERVLPPGGDKLYQNHKAVFISVNILALLYSLLFWTAYSYDYAYKDYPAWYSGVRFRTFSELFFHQPGEVVMDANGMFYVAAVAMLFMIFIYYRHFTAGSKSIYVMKRIKNEKRLLLNILFMPVLSAAVCVVNALLIMVIYYALYMIITPDNVLKMLA
ncbi:MAG: hypothetical protein K6G40_04770 [Eubacterium sp.]|nr:hypothetical protein [Eubacterium sp.]